MIIDAAPDGPGVTLSPVPAGDELPALESLGDDASAGSGIEDVPMAPAGEA